METKIPGLACHHRVISPRCRANHGDQGSVDIAVASLKDILEKLIVNKSNVDVSWHIVLTREDKENG